MKRLLVLLAFVTTLAHAGVENMVAQCEAVMACDLCRIERDSAVYTTERKQVFLPGLGLRSILVSDYNWIREAADAKTPEGAWLMCRRVREAMTAPDSGRGIAARTLFNADWQKMDYCPAAVRR